MQPGSPDERRDVACVKHQSETMNVPTVRIVMCLFESVCQPLFRVKVDKSVGKNGVENVSSLALKIAE